MENVIRDFYTAFQNLDAEKMVAHYHDEIEFTDPGFGTLKGERAKNMWRMLIEGSVDLKLEFSDVHVEGNTGRAHWTATYTFSRTGRKVVNEIDARFLFKDDKIIQHIDTFNLHKWAGQALGFKGWLFGRTRFFKKKLHAQTAHLLNKFEEKNQG